MQGLGVMLIILGVGSYVLPFIGVQFLIFTAFGPAAPFIGIVFIIIGLVVLIWSRIAERQNSGYGHYRRRRR